LTAALLQIEYSHQTINHFITVKLNNFARNNLSVGTVIVLPLVTKETQIDSLIRWEATEYQKNVMDIVRQVVLQNPKDASEKKLKLTLAAMPEVVDWPLQYYT
jgi:hypothetical protein